MNLLTRKALPALAASLLFAGASLPARAGCRGAIESVVALLAQVDMNGNRALSVDFVTAYSAAAALMLSHLSAAEYFERRDAIRDDLADAIDVTQVFMVPGISAQIETCARGFRSFVFANYEGPGEHRLDVSRAHRRLEFGPDEFFWQD